MDKSILKVDWATHKSVEYACRHWHYSRSVPVGKMLKVGAWESGQFIGVVVFAWGMNKSLGSPYGLKYGQACELVRVAIAKHDCKISRIVAISLRFLKRKSPGIKLVVSFADPTEGHHGGIYQAGNWIYSGMSAKNYEWRLKGKRLNKRAYTGHNFGNPAAKVPTGAIKVFLPGKHRYLMPLDAEMRERIAPLAQKYPKRPKKHEAGDQPEVGGAVPTRTLQTKEAR